METKPCRSKRPNTYLFYTPELRAKIGKFAAEYEAAVKMFSKELGKPVSEGTVRAIKKKYYKA